MSDLNLKTFYWIIVSMIGGGNYWFYSIEELGFSKLGSGPWPILGLMFGTFAWIVIFDGAFAGVAWVLRRILGRPNARVLVH